MAIFLGNFALPFSVLAASAVPLHSSLLCQGGSEEGAQAELDRYLENHLKAHTKYLFARDLKAEVKAKAKAFLAQRVIDKRAELCATRLKIVEDIKASAAAGCAQPSRYLEPYVRKVAISFDENKKYLEEQHKEYVTKLQKKLFEIASGSTTGLDGIFHQGYLLTSAPKEVKVDWLKEAATELGAEIHQVWGAVDSEKNPLVRDNSEFAREAISTKRKSDASKKSESCARSVP